MSQEQLTNEQLRLCTIDTCPIDTSSLHYQPSIPLNSLLIALFGLSFVSNLIQGVKFKTWGFMIAMLFGNATEIIGYAGRIWAHHSPWAADPVSEIHALHLGILY